MMKRSTELDRKIHDAAFEEFMRVGYLDASMREIAYHAGVTIGALYTRYSTKDEMFVACVSDVMRDIDRALEDISVKYSELEGDLGLARAMDVVKYEKEVMTDVLIGNYEQTVLLLHRSHGSSVGNLLDMLIDRKVVETLKHLDMAGWKVDPEYIRFMIDMQLRSGLSAIMPGRSPEDARSCMELNYKYHIGGWKAILDDILVRK